MEARSAKVEPITLPEPAMFSRSGVTVWVDERARLTGGESQLLFGAGRMGRIGSTIGGWKLT